MTLRQQLLPRGLSRARAAAALPLHVFAHRRGRLGRGGSFSPELSFFFLGGGEKERVRRKAELRVLVGMTGMAPNRPLTPAILFLSKRQRWIELEAEGLQRACLFLI